MQYLQQNRVYPIDLASSVDHFFEPTSYYLHQLVLVTSAQDQERFVFMEANARLQVEHTITEEIMGVDLAQTQIRLAAGATLPALGITLQTLGIPRGMAIEAQVNMERILRDGEKPGSRRPANTLLNFAMRTVLSNMAALPLRPNGGGGPSKS